MVVTVTYVGIPIVKGAPAESEAGDRLFIPCEFPMPVGTAVQVELDHAQRRFAQVVRVLEVEGGQGAGMAIEWRSGPEPLPMPVRAAHPEPPAASGQGPATPETT